MLLDGNSAAIGYSFPFRPVALRPRLSAGMPLSDEQYAKFGFLLQDRQFQFLIQVTGDRKKALTPSHFYADNQARKFVEIL